ncbi:uncharacterized protein RJT20DRAFT_4289 [Scheffersomyces xylosifermentans]|uniref:uncharacterized protein n=1 Tax=Scheffersomyces xylosifermentans TaxID=1304137 RepID=UPI00315CECB6
MTTVLENNIPNHSLGDELADYLIYATITNQEPQIFESIKPIAPKKMADIPQRSPARLTVSNVRKFESFKFETIRIDPSQEDVSDTSSFEETRSTDRSSMSDVSIFSDQTAKGASPNRGSSPKLGDDDIDLSDIEDIDELLEELEITEDGKSNIICQIDDVISIVKVHAGANDYIAATNPRAIVKRITFVPAKQ